jgi:hypothetical protein
MPGPMQEQYRSALQRTARALKKEQGRHLQNLREELEQLKIEYMARLVHTPSHAPHSTLHLMTPGRRAWSQF